MKHDAAYVSDANIDQTYKFDRCYYICLVCNCINVGFFIPTDENNPAIFQFFTSFLHKTLPSYLIKEIALVIQYCFYFSTNVSDDVG